MVIFNENTMIKAQFNSSFVLCGDEYGIAISGEDGNIGEYEFVETRAGQECWVFSGIFSENYGDDAVLFVYIPELDYATTVVSSFIDIGLKK